MRARIAGLIPALALLACGPEPKPHASDEQVAPPPAAAEAAPTEPAPPPAPSPPPADPTAPAPAAEDDPVLAERKQALANVGRSAFDALEAGDFAKLRALTPLDDGPLKQACAELPLGDRRELEARFEHCHESIPWAEIAEAQAFAGKPTGEQAAGCDPGFEDYGRLLLFLHLNDATIWRVEFFGAIGQDGNVVGLNGEVACKQVDSAPGLSSPP